MSNLKQTIKQIPVVGGIIKKVYRAFNPPALEKFENSPTYWENRYAEGRNSGSGSYNRLAEFKADLINGFIKENDVKSFIEFGCGDGNQLRLIAYPSYIGLDVSRTVIKMTAKKFENDKTKSFYVYDTASFVDNHRLFKADVSLSLDVIYHLVEDEIFEGYMRHVFDAANRFVIIYSSDFDSAATGHERNRNFSKFVAQNITGWELMKHVKNPYGYSDDDQDNTSRADFFIYRKR